MSNQKTAKKYERLKLILSLSETILSIILIMILVFSDYSIELRNLVSSWVENSYLRLFLFLGILGFIFSILSFPFSFVSGFWLEHYYKLSNQTFFAWIWEKCKAFALGILLFIPILIIFYYFLLNHPQTWWLWTASVLFVFSVVIGRLAPVLIFPLFYKFEKIDDEGITGRMEKLAKEGKFKLEGVFRFNMSKTTKKANAAFTGLGKSKRIILGDTLIEKFSLDEIESVFAHEVGHFVHKHLMIGVVVNTITSFLSLYVAYIIYNFLILQLGFESQADLAALPLLSLILTGISLLTSPLTNAQSRRHERQADLYALENSSNPASFLAALKKLGDTNLTDESPHPIIEFLFHSHPSIKKRIEFAEQHGISIPTS